jgi:hypothetical protein
MFNSNADLHDYLLALSSQCRALGMTKYADKAEFAAQYISGSPSEFLHEAQAALVEIAAEANLRLGEKDHHRVLQAIQEIEKAFKAVGGA